MIFFVFTFDTYLIFVFAPFRTSWSSRLLISPYFYVYLAHDAYDELSLHDWRGSLRVFSGADHHHYYRFGLSMGSIQTTVWRWYVAMYRVARP